MASYARLNNFLSRGVAKQDAQNMAQYKLDKEKYDKEQLTLKRMADYETITPQIEEAIKGMSPERQNLMKLSQAMIQTDSFFDKGVVGLDRGASQRGTMLSDIARSDLSTKSSNASHQYKVDNPIKAGESAKERLFSEYKDSTPEGRRVYDQFARASQMKDAGLYYQDTRDPTKRIDKNIIGTAVAEGQAEKTSNRLNNFYSDVDNTEDLLTFGANMREDIQKLYNETDQTSVGYGGLFSSGIPLLPANQWVNLRDSVVSNVGLNKLMDLKASSSTGASGLGGLNQPELTMLQNHLGNLKNTSSPEEIKRILVRMDKDLSRIERKRKRNLVKSRNWYNKNKGMLGEDVKLADFIPKEQEYLFTPGGFSKQDIDTPLEEGELDYSTMSSEELLKLMESEANK